MKKNFLFNLPAVIAFLVLLNMSASLLTVFLEVFLLVFSCLPRNPRAFYQNNCHFK